MTSKTNPYLENILKHEKYFSSYCHLNDFPILVLNASLRIIAANPKASEFFKLSPSEIKKKSFYSLTPGSEQKEWKSKLILHQKKEHCAFDIPLMNHSKEVQLYRVTVCRLSPAAHKAELYAATIYTSNEHVSLIKNLKNQNKELTEQAKKMVEINRKIVSSYENVKKQYEDLLHYQEENIKVERQKTIIEMVEVFQDKINKPLTRILDDIQKINDSEKKLNSAVVKRLKLIEESVENIMRVISHIAEVKDIKKMKYIELSET
ncbi:MAG: PAS domain-containing protein [Candidatus Aureabacteria bacterium]|nr:PAS domain-containing protein [Candidatus Auribacterota bacterium]